jgi:phenylacetic acid degradation operon negative regulatory protein
VSFSGQELPMSEEDLDLRPLTARSVILSVLLGSHPPLLPVRSLVRTAELFGISEGTTRVALSRLVADGDVAADRGRYRLSDRLVTRQQRLDEGRVPATQPWRGAWEIGVVDQSVRSAAERAEAGADLESLRMVELRRGVWVRPANLRRIWPESLHRRIWRFESRIRDSARSDQDLASSLWDLDGWAAQAEALLAALKGSGEPGRSFVVAAAMARHLRLDPLLPPALLPAHWPGRRLRHAYDGYAAELRTMLRDEWVKYQRGTRGR